MSISRSAPSCLALSPPVTVASLPVQRGEFEIVGSSAAMRRLRLQVRRIGPHFRAVLVSGEPGTEREWVARALHGMNQDSRAPFVACQAAAFDDALAECDASVEWRDGVAPRWNMSQRATLFLDEVSEMPLEAQGRLLEVLKRHGLAQSRLNGPRRMDLRMVASTSEDLKILVSTGRFRQDLYQRLATVDITVPPLRERIEDLPELSRYFLDRFALLDGRCFRGIAEDAMELMRRYHWPGNARELESMLRDGFLQSKGGLIELYHLPVFAWQSGIEQSMAVASSSARLQDVVEQHVLRVLKNCGGNKLRAAEVLGISRSTLYRMLDTTASAQ
jgi:DNA-binding NtrC family response regulator